MSLTGANTTPLGRLHPILAAKQQGPTSPGSKREAGNFDPGEIWMWNDQQAFA